MDELPVMLRIAGRRCVIVGGGAVALRRARALVECGANVTVIAPGIGDELAALPVQCLRRRYEPGDLRDALLVVVATDDPATNDAVTRDARAAGVLVNRTDNPEAGDLAIPAHARHGRLTVAVHTGGVSAAAAASIRDELSKALPAFWPTLLEEAAPCRDEIQRRVREPGRRAHLLRRLTDHEAVTRLTTGGVDALRGHYRRLLHEADSSGKEAHE